MSQVVVNMELTGIEKLKKSQVNDAIRAALYAMGVRWRRRYLPVHFTKAGARKYGYAPRKGESGSGRPFKGSYTWTKLKRFSHALPLVYSGELRRLTTQGVRQVKAVANSTKSYVVASMPRKANWKHPNSNAPPIEELRRLSDDERRDLEQFLVTQIERELNKRGGSASASISISGGGGLRRAA